MKEDADSTNYHPVVLTGVGCICAAGATSSESVTAMYAGKRNASCPGRIQTTHSVQYPVFEIPDHWLSPEYNQSPQCLRCGGLALHAARQAVRDAGLGKEFLMGLQLGVSIGTTVGSEVNSDAFHKDYAEGGHPELTPIRDYLKGSPAEAVAREWGGAALCQMVNNACASGTVAIGQAAGWIRSGLCDIAIAGGAEHLSRIAYDGFVALQVMDEQLSRPFDHNRSGLNLGEGAGVVVLESEEHARRRDAEIRGRILGYGNTSDAYHASGPRPDGDGLGRAIDMALVQADLDPGHIAFINAHGTGTRSNDRTEGALYSEEFRDIPFLSTKGYTGHTLGAAGGLEAVFTLAFLHNGEVPASAGFKASDPDFESNPVSETTAVTGEMAISSSIAFGGNNAVLIIGRAPS